VLLIDGLDEGTDAEGLLEGLPKADLPERVLVVYSSREHPRVRELVYGNLDRERHWELDLAGLSSADVRALLQDSVDKYALEGGYVEAVAERSGGNPQYLRLLVDGLQAGDYRLNDRVSLPRKMEELYDTLTKRFARTPRCVETLCLLAAARDYLTASQAADVLGVPTSEIRDQALPACREVLFENPLTERAEDYQLFHESLREHLRNRYAREVGECAEKLADWCLRWRDHGAEMRAYAVRHAISHLLDSQAAAARERRAELAEKRLRQACGLLDDKAYREEVFLTCGNAGPLQQGLIRAQRLLAERDRDGSELGRIVQYALWYHGEGHRLYEEQLARLDQIGREGGREGMEQAAQLAAMGATPRDRVLLALRALRARDARVDAPPALRKAVEGWLEEAGSGALRELWNETIGPAKV
jgi:hypothetical protein